MNYYNIMLFKLRKCANDGSNVLNSTLCSKKKKKKRSTFKPERKKVQL